MAAPYDARSGERQPAVAMNPHGVRAFGRRPYYLPEDYGPYGRTRIYRAGPRPPIRGTFTAVNVRNASLNALHVRYLREMIANDKDARIL